MLDINGIVLPVMHKMAVDICIYASEARVFCIVYHDVLISFGLNSCNTFMYNFQLPIYTSPHSNDRTFYIVFIIYLLLTG